IYSGVKSIKYPADKDMTDGEICVRYAAAEGFGDVVIYGALGGRQDHVEGNIALLYLAKRLGIKAVIKDKDIEIHYADNSRSFFATVKKNIFVSIVPFFSFVHIIKTTGLKYPLIDARIEKYSSLGISNVAVDEKISVEIKKSAALIIVNG
ncbi:MAG: thiamine diphosphokinase, partial [Clostridiales bacterium]|nr:thiamine diphosphokinase [Clostridiales bacterium]